MELGYELREDQMKGPMWGQKAPSHSTGFVARGQPASAKPKQVVEPTTPGPSRLLLTYFQCRKPGHRAAECGETSQKRAVGTPNVWQGTARKSTKTTPEQLRGTNQVAPMTPSEVMATPAKAYTPSSKEEVELDPMVRTPIKPFVIPVVVEAGRRRNCMALVDTGCTRCLMSLGVATSLGWGLGGCPVR